MVRKMAYLQRIEFHSIPIDPGLSIPRIFVLYLIKPAEHPIKIRGRRFKPRQQEVDSVGDPLDFLEHAMLLFSFGT